MGFVGGRGVRVRVRGMVQYVGFSLLGFFLGAFAVIEAMAEAGAVLVEVE